MDSVAMINRVLGETNRIVDGIEPSQLDNPTPCGSWTVREVLNHITGGADMFAIAASEGKVPDEQLGQLMAGDNLGDDYKGAFKAASARATKAFEPEGVLDKVITLPFGERLDRREVDLDRRARLGGGPAEAIHPARRRPPRDVLDALHDGGAL